MRNFSDIEKLAMHDPVVRQFLIFYKQGDLTKEEALINMVLHLAEEKMEMAESLINALENVRS